MADAEKTIRELLKNIAREQRYYDNYDIAVSPVSNAGANFTTHLYSATISSPNKSDLQLFIKVAALTETFRKNSSNFYDIEYRFYTDVARTFDKLQDKYNIRGDKRLVLPKFYGCSMKFLEETFVFEDLTVSGLTTLDRLKVVDWKYAAKAVEKLAKLHALSVAYGQNYPEQYRKSLKDFEYVLNFTRPNFEAMWASVFSTVLDFTREDNKEKLQKFVENQGGIDMFERYNKPYRCPVLAHGDFRTSNLMHKVCDDGSIDIAILDYQTLRTSSMPSDLVYFIFTSTDQLFRRRYMHQLVEHYYKSLRTALHLYGVHINDVYPREDFDYELKKVMPYCLAVTILILSIVLVEEAPAVDENLSLQDIAMKPGELYRERLNGILDDFLEWGVL